MAWALGAAAFLVCARAACGQDVGARVDSLFGRWAGPASPGCALGVVRHGQVVYSRAYGSANLDYGVPLSDSSVFYLASVSKQFTAAAVALAARKGLLSLDDDVRRYLPELPDYGVPITVSELVHHTSGVRDYIDLLTLTAQRNAEVLTDSEVFQLISRQKALEFTPGTRWSYSNSGYVLLSLIIQRATGRSLRAFTDEYLFRPLGMADTHFHDRPLQPIRNRAIGYDRVGSAGFTIDYHPDFDKLGDGGLYSSIRDLVRWDREFYEDRIGGRGFAQELTTTAVLRDGTDTGYGFGLEISKYRGLPIVEHAGGLMGYRSEILRFPQQRFTVVTLCNVGEANPPQLARRVADIFLSRQLAPPDPVGKAAPAVAAVDGAPLSGLYRDTATGTLVDVVVDSGRLTLSFGGTRFPFEPITATRFRWPGSADTALVFHGVSSGHATALELGQSTYVAVPPLEPSAEELESYTGRYYSDELASTYVVAVREGRLTVEAPLGPVTPLRSAGSSEFSGAAPGFGPVVLRFTRLDGGRATGFALRQGPMLHGILFRRE